MAGDGLRWVIGADGVAPAERVAFEQAVGLAALHDAQAGLIEDMDRVARALYDSVEA